MGKAREVLPRVLAASRFVAQQRERDPERFEHWLSSGFFEQATRTQTPPPAVDTLRKFRNAEMTRIAFRDIAGWATLEETLSALSGLADECCKSALAAASEKLQKVHGRPGDAHPLVLALGKLGGGELNFSSDIDLIFCFTENGETAGPRRISNEEYFGKLAQEFTRLLAERTADGFVFRVDWMLRPFGSAGPPAISCAAMEEYYQSHGREWERYALIKARPVAGDVQAGARLLQSLTPFIYRRYLDFNSIDHLRELKAKIEADARTRGLEDDLKLGDGGIREIEFIVQSFQLMRGGQQARLRDPRLRPVLRYLGEMQWLPAETAGALDQAYVFLRRAENAVQMYEDQQTHALPFTAEARAALTAALGFESWAEFLAQLDLVRARVRTEFGRVFSQAQGPASDPLKVAIARLWQDDAKTLEAVLRTEGWGDDTARVLRSLQDLRQSSLAKSLPEAAADRLCLTLARLLRDARNLDNPAQSVLRALEVIVAVTGRSTYLSLLRDHAVAREHLLKLCGASPWLTRYLAQAPVLLDQLLDPQGFDVPPERAELRAELAVMALETKAGDTEGAMNLLRRFVQEATLRIAAADLSGVLPLVKVSDRLTWLAEVVVEQALLLAQQDLRPLHGEPRDPAHAPLALAVIGYGKFGGLELGYGSDLDLVFLHASTTPEAETVGGTRPLTHAEYFSRWVQRTVSLLSAQTYAGRAYEVDLALRPSGNSGLLVSGLKSFAEYQRREAWTWEHQALTRARFVAGDAGLGKAFEALRAEIIGQPRETGKLRREILDMRIKMLSNLDKGGEGRFDVKQGRGGVTDIEFITQFLVLRDAHRAPELARWSDNWRQLEVLETAGSVSRLQKETLIRVYRAYRAWLHARSLQSQDQVAEDSVFEAERAEIRALWQEFLGE
ncbi:MAG: bifunctional [glutamate--ammonia ligase]-adenylyl-L-tyrosine phosphorylase/[glutamate--ammonia-ligase] adenylyltransferase [Pseudomonadota bacterium]